ncbi:AfsR/SARP family transcriptional regulator [Sphingomonas sp. KC8]|uniref:AfsR/SARP family transcriptional regulator n=1 Tax=Sphingomonas sp. KC8 TaxID=1030157 RepID=UPI00024885F3|nr:BTAD domain-containing putative transcriptional regulator [Sphingomonas sp. KC8]
MDDPATDARQGPASRNNGFELRCWGQFALFHRGEREDCSPRGRKARAIIAYLASHNGAGTSRERLAGLLWSERGDRQARASLRQSLFELRTLACDGRPLVVPHRDHIQVDADLLTSDIASIEQAARTGRIADLTDLLAKRDDRLFDGLDNLDPAFDEWLATERAKQHDRIAHLAMEAARDGLNRRANGHVRTLISWIERLDNSSETLARLGMLADHADGDLGAVHHRFQRLCTILQNDLQIEPSQETRRLYQSLTAATDLPSPDPRARHISQLGDLPAATPIARPPRRIGWLILLVGIVAILTALALWLRAKPA